MFFFESFLPTFHHSLEIKYPWIQKFLNLNFFKKCPLQYTVHFYIRNRMLLIFSPTVSSVFTVIFETVLALHQELTAIFNLPGNYWYTSGSFKIVWRMNLKWWKNYQRAVYMPDIYNFKSQKTSHLRFFFHFEAERYKRAQTTGHYSQLQIFKPC